MFRTCKFCIRICSIRFGSNVCRRVQNHISGPKVVEFLQTVTPASVTKLQPFHSTLSAFLKQSDAPGGIVDDTVIVRLEGDNFYFVTNAACREKDADFISKELSSFKSRHGEAPTWNVMDGHGLIAIQGPLAAEILETVLADPATTNLKELYFGQSRYAKIKLPGGKSSSDVLISRGGYTGEDGFEISITGPETTAVTQSLLDTAGKDKLRLAGLGARDSLRLEAGMCLYGHDLNETITPPEAALGWIVGKDRREATKAEDGAFNGADVINAQLLGKSKGGIAIEKRRVGFIVDGAVAREGAIVYDMEGKEIGNITSGCPSPTLGKNIAMGYVKSGQHKAGTEVQIEIRKKMRKATVSKMPFVPSKYYKA
jgi:aminomethyltransferase